MKTMLAAKIAVGLCLAALVAYAGQNYLRPPLPRKERSQVLHKREPETTGQTAMAKPIQTAFAEPNISPSVIADGRTGFGLPQPLSFVRRESAWTCYSRAINQIQCASAINASETGGTETPETWLGTRGGIKCLDSHGRLRRLYTTADGLPGRTIIALAVTAQEAWCVTLTDKVASAYGLCRLDRTTDRWETLRTVPIPFVPCTDQTSAPSFIATGAADTICFVLGNAARGPDGLAACLWDRAHQTWQDVHWEARLHTDGCFSFPEPTWAGAGSRQNADYLWIGTTQGLARYTLSNQHWDWFLPGSSILGGTVAGANAFWLATLTKTDTRLIPATAGLHLRKFDPELAAASADYLAPDTNSDSRSIDRLTFPGAPCHVVATSDGMLWLVEDHPSGVFGLRSTLPASLTAFDTKTQTWQHRALLQPADKAALPPAVLSAALLAGYELPTEELRQRLPGWSSPPAVLPCEIQASSEDSEDTQGFTLADADGSVWSVEHDDRLTCRHASGTEQHFPPPTQTLAQTPPTWQTAVAGDTLYALTSASLWEKPLPGGPWMARSVPVESADSRPSDARLWTLGGQLWTQAGGTLRRLDEPAQTLPLPKGWVVQCLGEFHGKFWFQGERGNTLYRVSPHDPLPKVIRVDAYGKDHNTWGFIGFTQGIAWLSVQEGTVQQGDTLLYGYEVEAGTWTAPLKTPGHVENFTFQVLTDQETGKLEETSVCAAVTRRLDATGDGPVGDTYQFDLKTKQWQAVSPAVPSVSNTQRYSSSPDPLRLAAVDSKALWLVNTQSLAVWRWEIVRRVWTCFPAGASAKLAGSGVGSDGTVASRQEAIYVATPDGVWSFNTVQCRWTSLPMPMPAAGLTLRLCAADPQAVWGLAFEANRRAFAARFDKSRHLWKVWGAPQGFPETGEPTDIASDGNTAFVTTYLFGAFRLDSGANHWQDVSSSLADVLSPGRKDIDLYARQMQADQNGIWIRATGYWNRLHQPMTATEPLVPPLVYWDRQHRKFEAVAAPRDALEPSRWGDSFLTEAQAVWMVGAQSLWRLDKATHTWRRFPLPDDFSLVSPELYRAADGALWLCDRESAVRWQQPVKN